LLNLHSLTDLQCLIVDQDMPRMTGLELIAMLRGRGVRIPALLISGRFTPAVTREASAAVVPVIEKPFLGNGLVDSIRAAIKAKPG
jgi:FixJ family two-component response regulator